MLSLADPCSYCKPQLTPKSSHVVKAGRQGEQFGILIEGRVFLYHANQRSVRRLKSNSLQQPPRKTLSSLLFPDEYVFYPYGPISIIFKRHIILSAGCHDSEIILFFRDKKTFSTIRVGAAVAMPASGHPLDLTMPTWA